VLGPRQISGVAKTQQVARDVQTLLDRRCACMNIAKEQILDIIISVGVCLCSCGSVCVDSAVVCS
jgi:hypothetical protein